MKDKIILKLLVNKKDFVFLLIYIFLVSIIPVKYIKSFNYVRGFEKILDMSNPSMDMYIQLLLWIIYMIIPIIYILLEFHAYFEGGQYYFVRIKNRKTWLSIFLLRTICFLLLVMLIKSICFTMIYSLDVIIYFETVQIFLRDVIYYWVVFEIFLLFVFYMKKETALIISVIAFFLTALPGDIFLLNDFHSVELVVYSVIGVFLYSILCYRIDHQFDQLDI